MKIFKDTLYALMDSSEKNPIEESDLEYSNYIMINKEISEFKGWYLEKKEEIDSTTKYYFTNNIKTYTLKVDCLDRDVVSYFDHLKSYDQIVIKRKGFIPNFIRVLQFILYVLLTQKDRQKYYAGKNKGMTCTDIYDSSKFVYGSYTTYEYDPNKKPEKNYLTRKEFFDIF